MEDTSLTRKPIVRRQSIQLVVAVVATIALAGCYVGVPRTRWRRPQSADPRHRRGVRRRITVLELQQIIGRGRGLWRTADNPLHVLELTDVPLDMPVEELTTDAAERPSFEDRQIAVGAIAFECAAHRRSNLLMRS